MTIHWSGTYNSIHCSHPIKTLLLLFILWKSLLFVLVICSPGPGYDTSTALFFHQKSNNGDQSTWWKLLSHKFVRWDAIYFTQIAHRGYLLEQEWAFGYGYTHLLGLLSLGSSHFDNLAGPIFEALVGIILSHICHLLSVLVLYRLTSFVFSKRRAESESFPLVAATLHIACPAGAFLSAPYAEGLFSFVNLSGFYLYVGNLRDHQNHRLIKRDAKVVAAGLAFGLASTIRSNGILSGLLYAYDAVVELWSISINGTSASSLRRIIGIGIGGCLIAFGASVPQYLAYTVYCPASSIDRRSWCQNWVPSIYGWVQSHYWNVGFLRYWTLSNLPLFGLAAPMLVLVCQSSAWACQSAEAAYAERSDEDTNEEITHPGDCLRRLALPQSVLAILAFTSYHVQIITRLSSGYPVWYWWLASSICHDSGAGSFWFGAFKAKVVVRWMVIYAIIQGGLFASFLPPA